MRRQRRERLRGGALSRPVVGIFSTPAGFEYRKPVRRDQIFQFGTRTGGIKRRVFDEPDAFACSSCTDGVRPGFHEFQRRGIGCQAIGNNPFHRRIGRAGEECPRLADVTAQNWCRYGHDADMELSLPPVQIGVSRMCICRKYPETGIVACFHEIRLLHGRCRSYQAVFQCVRSWRNW